MPPDESRRSREEFDRMLARVAATSVDQRSELDRRRAELEARMERLRTEIAAARDAFQRTVEEGGDAFGAARKYRDRFGAWPSRKLGRGRPRRGKGDGAPAPVRPRPNPTPLTDGAEAPID